MNQHTLLAILSLGWIISEIALARLKHSDSAKSSLDKSSIRILWITITLATTLGVYLGSSGIGFLPTGSAIIAWFGLSLIIAGLALRWTAIFTLRQFFTVDVAIQTNHTVVNTGLYKHIRHPSYTGSLLSFLGLGMAFSNWLSVLVIFVPVTAAFIHRINIEEAALTQYLGDAYIQYSASTKRLVPKVY
jgi:protein-S-isoprenylcysteine O-methyltransferase Ste14